MLKEIPKENTIRKFSTGRINQKKLLYYPCDKNKIDVCACQEK